MMGEKQGRKGKISAAKESRSTQETNGFIVFFFIIVGPQRNDGIILGEQIVWNY